MLLWKYSTSYWWRRVDSAVTKNSFAILSHIYTGPPESLFAHARREITAICLSDFSTSHASEHKVTRSFSFRHCRRVPSLELKPVRPLQRRDVAHACHHPLLAAQMLLCFYTSLPTSTNCFAIVEKRAMASYTAVCKNAYKCGLMYHFVKLPNCARAQQWGFI